MGFIFQSLGRTVLAGIVILLVMMGIANTFGMMSEHGYWQFFMRWLHILSGVMWIGLLWYFNFVQTRKMPDIPPELKPAVSKFIAPEAMFWFRWAALFTVLMGLILAYNRGYLLQALALGFAETPASPAHSFIGLGMWLGIIMMVNVWAFIWPAQKIALGIVDADADAKAAAGRKGMIFSRINTLLSVPMLVTMTMNQTIFG